MRNIIVFTKDIFFEKNLVNYVSKNNLPFKLYFFKDKFEKIKLKKLFKRNLFVIIYLGLSGSIQYNIKNGPKIYEDNTKLYYDIINNLKELNFKNVFFVSASCAYPNNKRILNEKYYGYPPLEVSSFFYSQSKIFGSNICRQINLNKNYSYITLIPATLYGDNSNYHKLKSHVITALLHKMKKNVKFLTLWGSGKPKREFLHIEDFINAIFFINKKKLKKNIINIGTGEDFTISALANKIKKYSNFKGTIKWDKSKSDGAMKKLLDSSYLNKKGWKAKKNLDLWLKEFY